MFLLVEGKRVRGLIFTEKLMADSKIHKFVYVGKVFFVGDLLPGHEDPR